MTISRCLTTTALVLVLSTGLAYTLHQWLTLPEVFWSFSAHKCIKVVPASAGTCQALPPRYILTYVR